MLEQSWPRYPTPVPDAIEARAAAGGLAAQGRRHRRAATTGSTRSSRPTRRRARAHRSHAVPGRQGAARARRSRRAMRSAPSLTAPLKKSLVAKRKALETALAATRRAAEYQVAEVTTAATYEMAELYRTLAKDLLASERPKKLKGEELEQYDALLEEQVVPLRGAGDRDPRAQRRARQDGVYDDRCARASALAELKPGALWQDGADPGCGREPRISACRALAAGALALAAARRVRLAREATGRRRPASVKRGSRRGAAAHRCASTATPAASARRRRTSAAGLAARPRGAPGRACRFDRAVKYMRAGKATEAELGLQAGRPAVPAVCSPARRMWRSCSASRASSSRPRRLLKSAVARESANAVAWTELGVTLRMRGEFQDAAASYEKAIAADPNYAPA